MLDVAVIIVSWNVRDCLAECISSVYADLRHSGVAGDVWIVDNGSTDGTLELLSNLFPNTHVIANQKNAGFAAANNQGMAAASASDPRFFFLLNPDTVVRPGAIRQMVQVLESCPETGMVGPRLVYRDGRLQDSAFAFPGVAQLLFELWPLPRRFYDTRFNGRYPRRAFRPDGPPFAVDHPLGAAMMVRRDVAEKTGGFDESFHMYCEEIDWSWRIRNAGWAIYSVPGAEIVHYGGESTKQVPARSVISLWSSRARLYRKHHGRMRWQLSRRLAAAGLRRLAARAPSAALQEAYLLAAQRWHPEGAAAQAQSEIATS